MKCNVVSIIFITPQIRHHDRRYEGNNSTTSAYCKNVVMLKRGSFTYIKEIGKNMSDLGKYVYLLFKKNVVHFI